MNRLLSSVAFAGAALLLATGAPAVDIENADQTPYLVKLFEGNDVFELEVAAGSVQTGVCKVACRIEIGGLGSIEASETDVVLIQEGRLSKKPKASPAPAEGGGD